MIEIANRTKHGRVVGTDYVVTAREFNRSGILVRFREREDAEAWQQVHADCCIARKCDCVAKSAAA